MYKLFIQEYNIMENDYITREKIIKTNDIYHEIGKIYCQSLVKIKRIDFLDITKDLEQEIERLKVRISKQRQANEKLQAKYDLVHSIIKEVREYIKDCCYDYDFDTYSNMSSSEVKGLLEILDKEVN